MNRCPDCGGTGLEPDHDGYTCDGDCCPRCAYMPKLHCWLFEEMCQISYHGKCERRGWFKPDPDEIVRWCLQHESVTWHEGPDTEEEPERCFYLLFRHEQLGIWHVDPCRMAWIAKPKPLEEDR